MIEWKFVCNAPKCAGIYALKSNSKVEIRCSTQLRKELKKLYNEIDPNEYDIEILETLKDIFGEQAILKLEESRKKYLGEVKEESIKNEINPEMINWYKAITKTTKYVAISLEDLITILKLNNEDEYVISKYYEK